MVGEAVKRSGTPRRGPVPRWVAVHEAGHAVAGWAMQRALGLEGYRFQRILVRSAEEVAAGAHVTGLGCRVNCLGMVEETARYQPVGHYVPDGMQSAASRAERGRMIAAWRNNMEADVIELLAGTLAEARCRRIARTEVLRSGGRGDYALALRKAHDFARDEHELGRLMNGLWRRAATLLRDPAHWAAVGALADALLERHTLDGAEACTLIEQAVAAWRGR